MSELGLDDLSKRIQVRAAERVDHTLRLSSRAGGVIDGNWLLLVQQKRGHTGRIALREQLLVGIGALPIVVDPHDLDARRRLRDQRLELGIHEQHARPRVLEHVADLECAEPGVERDQDAACRRHAVQQLQQGRGVGTQGRNPVVRLQSMLAKCGGEAVHTLAQLPVAVAAVKVHNRDTLGMYGDAAVEE